MEKDTAAYDLLSKARISGTFFIVHVLNWAPQILIDDPAFRPDINDIKEHELFETMSVLLLCTDHINLNQYLSVWEILDESATQPLHRLILKTQARRKQLNQENDIV